MLCCRVQTWYFEMLNENEMTASQVHVSSLLPFIALRPETRNKGKDGANDGQRAYLLLRWSLQRHRQRHVQCHFRKGLSLWGYFLNWMRLKSALASAPLFCYLSAYHVQLALLKS